MKKTILFISIFACFLVMMMPVIPAVITQNVSHVVNEEIKEIIFDKMDSRSSLSGLIKDEDYGDFVTRIVGFMMIILFLLFRKFMNSFSRFISYRILSICWFIIISVLNGLIHEYSFVKIYFRSIGAFVIGLLFPILWLTFALNLYVFSGVIGPVVNFLLLIYSYALG